MDLKLNKFAGPHISALQLLPPPAWNPLPRATKRLHKMSTTCTDGSTKTLQISATLRKSLKVPSPGLSILLITMSSSQVLPGVFIDVGVEITIAYFILPVTRNHDSYLQVITKLSHSYLESMI